MADRDAGSTATALKEWQAEWPAEEGAWWFCGRLPGEINKTLIVAIVKKTVNEPPVYLAAWVNNIWQEGQIDGRWLKIETPTPPED